MDEMYSPRLAEALRSAGIDASTVAELGLTGAGDPEILTAAIAEQRVLLTENVADFTRTSAEHLVAGRHHPGVLVALSSRFSRRAAGIGPLLAAILDISEQQLSDCLVHLEAPAAREPSPKR